VAAVEHDEHRREAARLFNACWTLLEAPGRTPDQDVELLTDAFASRCHWLVVGGPEQLITSDWMVSRAAAATGHAALAVQFAERAERAAREPGLPDWLVASCAEGMARACAAAGDDPGRRRWRAAAATLVEAITDEQERSIIAEQLASVPG
jgi:hypothetical protein